MNKRKKSGSAQFDESIAVARAKGRAKRAEAKVAELEAKQGDSGAVEVEKLAKIRNYMKNAMGPRDAHYEAANTGRWENDWSSSRGTPYDDIKGGLNRAIARSRREIDNSGFAQNARNIIVDNVVSTGIRPIPTVRKVNGEPNDIINQDLRRAWEVFNDEFDRSKRSTFYEMQSLALSTIFSSGSILTNQVRSEGTLLPIAYQFREPDRLDYSKDFSTKSLYANSNVKQVVHGIAIDEYDVPHEYWFQGVKDPISSEFIKLTFKRTRPEQYIGMPWMAPVLKRLWDVRNLIEDQAIKSRMTAMIALWFEGDNGLPPIGAQDTDDDSFKWYPGAVGRGGIGSKPNIIQADDNIKDGYMPIVKLLLREAAVALGVSYYSIARDIEDMNFAGSRAIIIDERRHFTSQIKWFSKEFCQPHYNDFVQWCALTGKVRGLTIDRFSRDPKRYTNCFWVPVPWDWVDPVKDVDALIKLKDQGWMTDEMYLQARGVGVKDLYEQLKKEDDMKKEIGIQQDAKPKQQVATKDNPTVADSEQTLLNFQ